MHGRVRSGRETDDLLKRLNAGDIAVVDHVDLDGTTAQALVDKHVVAVVNAAPSTSGRYPNLGPRVLVDNGVLLLDHVGAGVFTGLQDGKRARVHDDALWVGEDRVATGRVLDLDAVTTAADHARAGLTAQLADLVANTTGFLLDERDVLLDGTGIPWTRTPLEGRDVVVVVDAHQARAELAALRRFVKRRDPVFIGVDAGADLLLENGHRPHLVLGNSSRLSASALAAAQEVVHRGVLPDGALDRRKGDPAPSVRFGTSIPAADLALLIADQAGARTLTVVGFPTTTEQVLDHGRAGAPSALLVRLHLLDRVIGAQAAAALTPRRALVLPLVLALVAAGLGAGFDPQTVLDRWNDLPF